MRLGQILWMGLLLIAVVVSGVQVAYYSQFVRALHGQLQACLLYTSDAADDSVYV